MQTRPSADGRYPAWVRLPYTLFVAVLVPIYWRDYGPGNFLWFSDIALFAVLVALWTGNRLVYSMMAVGVLPLELAWTLDFVSGGNLIGLAAYMFDTTIAPYLRALSLFHLFLPPIILWMLVVQGYDRRALRAQLALAWVVLPLTWVLTSPEDNINWVHGLGPDAERFVPPLIHLGLYMALLPVVFVPVHRLLRYLFGEHGRWRARPAGAGQAPTGEPGRR
jgi:hypothetical protein